MKKNATVRQIQLFVAVAQARSFVEACEKMNLSQPALSLAIRKLEDTLGGALLARSTRSVTLTPEGQQFFPVAKRLLADWERSLQDVSDLFELQVGRLDIAAMPTFAGTLLPELLLRFHRHHPAIKITVHDIIAEEVVDAVSRGRVDLGISFEPPEADDLDFTPLFKDRFLLVAQPGHDLLSRKRLTWRDLAGERLIGLQKPSSFRRQVDSILDQYKVALSPSFEAHQLVVVGRMAAQGLGIAVVPELSRGQMEELGAQCRLIVPQQSRSVGMLTNRRRPLSQASRALFDLVLESYRGGSSVRR